MVEEVRVPSEPDGKDVVKEDDTQGQGPVKVRHDHPIFKSVDDGDMERLQNYLEVDSLKLHDQLNNRKMWQINMILKTLDVAYYLRYTKQKIKRYNI